MFPAHTYQQRRSQLQQALRGQGQILLIGNSQSPRNFAHNTYPFRQDSCFLYFFGLDAPGLYALIDTDTGGEILFGHDPSPDDIV